MKIAEITPDRVKLAYERTGLKPICGSWAYQSADGTCYACALTAVAVDEKLISYNDWLSVVQDYTNPIETIDAIDKYGAMEFARGFDRIIEGDPPEDIFGNMPLYKLGFACRKAVNPPSYDEVADKFSNDKDD